MAFYNTTGNAQAINSAWNISGNSDAIPIFRNTSYGDLFLTANDTAARNKGLALSSFLPPALLANMPDYHIDMNGVVRGNEGSWDIGALEYTLQDTGAFNWVPATAATQGTQTDDLTDPEDTSPPTDTGAVDTSAQATTSAGSVATTGVAAGKCMGDITCPCIKSTNVFSSCFPSFYV